MPRPAFGQNAGDLIAHPLGRDALDQGRQLADRREGLRFDVEIPAARRTAPLAAGEDDPREIESPDRRSRESDPASRSARPPTKSRISPVAGSRSRALIVKSRRSASWRGSVSKFTATGMPPIGVPKIAAEGGDFHLRLAFMHQHNAEVSAHLAGAGEQPQQFGRLRRGCHVEILRCASQQQIAHAPADEVRRMPRKPQALHDCSRQYYARGVRSPRFPC